MPHLNRQLLNVLFKSLLPLLVVACLGVVTARRGVNFWAAPRADEGSSPEALPGSEPSEEVAAVVRRLHEKQALAREVADGRLTLRDAAARYRELDEAAPGFHWEEFRRKYPGASDEERHCREVISFVRGLPDRKDGEEAVAARLESELQGYVARGDLSLPGAAAGPAVRR
jgi:hypothetical protein